MKIKHVKYYKGHKIQKFFQIIKLFMSIFSFVADFINIYSIRNTFLISTSLKVTSLSSTDANNIFLTSERKGPPPTRLIASESVEKGRRIEPKFV